MFAVIQHGATVHPSAAALHIHAQSAFGDSRHAEAVSGFEQLLRSGLVSQLDSPHMVARTHGMALASLGRSDEALHQWERAIKLWSGANGKLEPRDFDGTMKRTVAKAAHVYAQVLQHVRILPLTVPFGPLPSVRTSRLVNSKLARVCTGRRERSGQR